MGWEGVTVIDLRVRFISDYLDGLFPFAELCRQFNISRVFYCFVIGQKVIILHAFVKKTQETPEHELKIARKRMKEIQNG